MTSVVEVDNPLVLDRITRLRDKTTPSREFRQFVQEITMLLAADATNHLPLVDVDVETPLQVTTQLICRGTAIRSRRQHYGGDAEIW